MHAGTTNPEMAKFLVFPGYRCITRCRSTLCLCRAGPGSSVQRGSTPASQHRRNSDRAPSKDDERVTKRRWRRSSSFFLCSGCGHFTCKCRREAAARKLQQEHPRTGLRGQGTRIFGEHHGRARIQLQARHRHAPRRRGAPPPTASTGHSVQIDTRPPSKRVRPTWSHEVSRPSRRVVNVCCSRERVLTDGCGVFNLVQNLFCVPPPSLSSPTPLWLPRAAAGLDGVFQSNANKTCLLWLEPICSGTEPLLSQVKGPALTNNLDKQPGIWTSGKFEGPREGAGRPRFSVVVWCPRRVPASSRRREVPNTSPPSSGMVWRCGTSC